MKGVRTLALIHFLPSNFFGLLVRLPASFSDPLMSLTLWFLWTSDFPDPMVSRTMCSLTLWFLWPYIWSIWPCDRLNRLVSLILWFLWPSGFSNYSWPSGFYDPLVSQTIDDPLVSMTLWFLWPSDFSDLRSICFHMVCLTYRLYQAFLTDFDFDLTRPSITACHEQIASIRGTIRR